LENSSNALIWASMNIMPKFLGIIVLSGVLASAISSATTFLSLIGSNITMDILQIKEERKQLRIGRIIILIVSVLICVLCIIQPPQIFWITYLGATIVACSWLPVSIASVWSKRVTKTGAFLSMLSGFVVSSVLKIYVSVKSVTLPVFLDPFFVGLFVSIFFLILGSLFTKVSEKEVVERKKLFVLPEGEDNPAEIRKTKLMIVLTIPLGVIVSILLLVLWVIPYNKGLS
jgi:sodium/pantothenate symporter